MKPVQYDCLQPSNIHSPGGEDAAVKSARFNFYALQDWQGNVCVCVKEREREKDKRDREKKKEVRLERKKDSMTGSRRNRTPDQISCACSQLWMAIIVDSKWGQFKLLVFSKLFLRYFIFIPLYTKILFKSKPLAASFLLLE